MKKLILISTLLLTFMFCCCNNTEHGGKPEKISYTVLTPSNFRANYNIMIIDSCEYLTNHPNSTRSETFHKGNCKFCTSRLKELLNKN